MRRLFIRSAPRSRLMNLRTGFMTPFRTTETKCRRGRFLGGCERCTG